MGKFVPITHPNPNCIECPSNNMDTWPHLLSEFTNQHIKGLRIARHNKAVHLIPQALQRNKIMRFFRLVNAGTFNSKPLEATIPAWLINCTSIIMPCISMARLQHDKLRINWRKTMSATP